ncbi:MAG: hypothetical protein ACHQQ3_10400 [Gemmatimonadales bacterium]
MSRQTRGSRLTSANARLSTLGSRLVLSLSLAACTQFSSVRPETLAPASSVRVVLTGTGSDSLAPAFGPGVTFLHGSLERVRGDTIHLRVESVSSQGQERNWAHESVTIPMHFVDHVEREQFSRLRTGIVTAGSIAVVALLAHGFGSHGSGGGVTVTGSTGGK